MMPDPKATILIVDDNSANLRVLSDILHNAGFKVRAASSGAAALHAVELQLPHLILLDITMPEIDGYEVCRQLKLIPVSRDVPVIFVSALHEAKDKVKGFKLGAVDYILKPFDAMEVVARVTTHIELYRTRSLLEAQAAELSEANNTLQQTMKQLVLAQKRAALNRVMASVAHKVNTPLGNIVTSSSSLCSQIIDFKESVDHGLSVTQLKSFIRVSETLVTFIDTNSRKISGIIEDMSLLACAGLEQSRESFDLANLIQEVLLPHKEYIEAEGCQLLLTVPPGVKMNSYRDPLSQVLHKLTTFISDSESETFSSKLSIGLGGHDPQSVLLTVTIEQSVHDGCQIDELFERLAQFKSEFEPRDVELYIVSTLITDILGGSFSIYKHPQRGVCFELQLPRIGPDWVGEDKMLLSSESGNPIYPKGPWSADI